MLDFDFLMRCRHGFVNDNMRVGRLVGDNTKQGLVDDV